MTDSNFLIFGLGNEYLRYIGWTARALSDEEGIVLDLAQNSGHDIAQWIARVAGDDKIGIFEIESAPSVEDAVDAVQFWCQYYGLIGAKVAVLPR